MPPDYLDYYLCRYVYHCPPSELDRQDLHRVLAHLTCMDVEHQVERARAGH